MTKSKNTKRALLASVLSMMLCMAMLIGSTFAWFTDSVTSGKNKIVAGNLDVELYHTNGNVKTEEQVGETTNLFVNADGSAIKWEPGVMVYENFTVKNVGSLALKYKLTLNADCNTVDGKSLADVLKVAILDEAFTGDRAAAQALTFDKTVADFEKDGNLAADEAGKAGNTYAIVIYWEPSANDNDYNFNNERKDLDPLYIDLGVNLFATQDTVESDSFGKDYDKNAWPYPEKAATADEVKSAVEAQKNVELVENVTVTFTNSEIKPFVTFSGDDQALNFDGKTITIDSASGKNGILGTQSKTATLSNGTLEMNKGYGSSYPVINANKGTVVLNNMTVVNSSKSGITVSAGSDGGKVEIRNSTIEGGNKYSDAVFCGSQASVVIEGGAVIGCIRAANNGKIEIKGGDYTQATFESQYKEHIIVYEGLFDFDPSTSSKVKLADPDNTSVTDNGDGTWSVATVDDGNAEDPFA